MSAATIAKPAPKTKVKPVNKKRLPVVTIKPTKKACGGTNACENCETKVKVDKPARKKKKPMFKVGCWRGAFKGTLDF